MTLDGSAHLLELLDIQWPIIQAPMAGADTLALAAAVSNAGGLGSLGVGATNADEKSGWTRCANILQKCRDGDTFAQL
jgi:NAD(P)H-dependent flavin oxidoreductase YrpB (nitropropane dioxygenase family)